MDIEKELLRDQSYENAEIIAWYTMENPSEFEKLMKLFFEKDFRVTQRASQVIIICSEWKPKILTPFVEKMILNLKNSDTNDTVKRNTVRILAQFPIPKHLDGEITEICFRFLNEPNVAIAIKVFSMSILERMVKNHPELKNELIYSIEAGLEFGSAGYQNRGRKILDRLKNTKKEIKRAKLP